MSDAVMGATLYPLPEFTRADAGQGRWEQRSDSDVEVRHLDEAPAWELENFARAQIRGLVRQVFFFNPRRRVRQAVFSAIDPEIDTESICRQVGGALARETQGCVAIVGTHSTFQASENDAGNCGHELPPKGSLRDGAQRMNTNLWLVPRARSDDSLTMSTAHMRMCDLRREFEYSVVAGPVAASDEAIAMAQLADGIILVVSARCTRRATSLRIKRSLEAAQIYLLGTVLVDRDFPIPESIYRRL